MKPLFEAHKKLNWPSPKLILNPPGAGPCIYANLAKEKIEKAITRLQDVNGARVGVLTLNPTSHATESPFAIVCEFQKNVSPHTLNEVHKLAWNFSRSPLLFILEPSLIRAWTCCELPEQDPESMKLNAQVLETSFSQQAIEALQWINLASGQFIKDHENRFKREFCADYMLLKNLKSVRQQLINNSLDPSICHDLLARIIFIQFLFHRKDSAGIAALNNNQLNTLYKEGILQRKYNTLADILTNHNDSYNLFRWLNEKFNGDLFPGKDELDEEREIEWQTEMQCVNQTHLQLLSDFVSGTITMGDGQISLWPYYFFDVIPLEFISSIYEEFVGKKPGVVYTHGHIVDFILDGVLPWNSNKWNIKILDPACGSGIFLVKAYQRLIHRWKKAHPNKLPNAEVLRSILERNLLGIDNDEDAVRVASFSLYLAMCDEIDPRHYWKQVNFPRLRERRLIHADFFREDIRGFHTIEDSNKYDLVVGNPPWGEKTTTIYSTKWADYYEWPISNGDIGPHFLVKAAALTKENGLISMLQPAMTLIFNTCEPALQFRKKLFERHKVDEVVNLSAYRYSLFKKAISPACIITLRPTPSDKTPFAYICPKPKSTSEDTYRIIIEPQDINYILPDEPINNPFVWTVFMWGGRRDLSLIKKLSEHYNLLKLKEDGIALIQDGIIRGNKKTRHNSIVGRHILETPQFFEAFFTNSEISLHIKAEELPINDDPWTHRLTDLQAFDSPQLLIKKGWKKGGRFQSKVITTEDNTGVICNSNYVSVHTKEIDSKWLNAACLSMNSKLATYFLLLTSGRFAAYRPTVYLKDILSVPISKPYNKSLNNIRSFDEIDKIVNKDFELKNSERALIEDLFNYTLSDFKEGDASLGRMKTQRMGENKININEPDLRLYCINFIRVLKAGFGNNKNVSASIFHETNEISLPIRLVAIHFSSNNKDNINIEFIDSSELIKQLYDFEKQLLVQSGNDDGGIFYQRVVRIYTTISFQRKRIPTVFIIKPDQKRYWTQSAALRDADEVASDIMTSNFKKSYDT